MVLSKEEVAAGLGLVFLVLFRLSVLIQTRVMTIVIFETDPAELVTAVNLVRF